MMTIAIYTLAFFIFVALTMVLPGIKTIITPVWAAVGKGIVLLFAWSWGWVIYIVKAVYNAHIELFRNFILQEEDIDLRKKINKK